MKSTNHIIVSWDIPSQTSDKGSEILNTRPSNKRPVFSTIAHDGKCHLCRHHRTQINCNAVSSSLGYIVLSKISIMILIYCNLQS